MVKLELSLLLPNFGIPASTSTVSVSIVNTTSFVGGAPSNFFYVPDIKGNTWIAAPSWSFLIEHPKLKRNLLFDLGLRKDFTGYSPIVQQQYGSFDIRSEKGVRQVLEEGKFNVSSLEALIWSHWHFDHIGDPSTFDKKTALVVGPGFKANLLPGYPANPNCPILESDYAGRDLREITFDSADKKTVNIGQFKGYDYFGDGSYYLVNTPGHAVGHIGGLARVTSNPDSFIFMGGDTCHHAGELRPSALQPLPNNVAPNPFTSISAPNAKCPGATFDPILRNSSRAKSIYVPANSGVHFNVQDTADTIAKMQYADARDNILVAVAHDQTIGSVADLFPKKANDFYKKGWTTKLRWLFLREFAEAVGYKGKVEGRSYGWEKWNLRNGAP